MISVESTASCEIVIRRGQVSDIQAILALVEASPGAARWSRAEYASSCVPANTGESHFKAFFVASAPVSRTVVGFAAFAAVQLAGEYELANMAVAADCQRRGMGSRLLAAGWLWCRSWGRAIPSASAGSAGAALEPYTAPNPGLWLEVRASNRGAIAFYELAGFTAAGIRPGYYAQPAEDALVMWRPLNDHRIGGKLPQ